MAFQYSAPNAAEFLGRIEIEWNTIFLKGKFLNNSRLVVTERQ